MVGSRARDDRPQTTTYLAAQFDPRFQSIAVIGAGLAGVHSALALDQAGLDVSLFDPSPAHGGSGNDQGMLYIAPQVQATHASRFWLQGFERALHHYPQHPEFHRSGLLCCPENEEHEQQLQRTLRALGYPQRRVQWVDQHQASALANTHVRSGGLFWPDSGWVAVRDYVQRLAKQCDCRPEAVTDLVETEDGVWLTAAGHSRRYDAVVLANALAARLPRHGSNRARYAAKLAAEKQPNRVKLRSVVKAT